MRTANIDGNAGEAAVSLGLEEEAKAWRSRRATRPELSLDGVQVVRIPKRRFVPVGGTRNIERPQGRV